MNETLTDCPVAGWKRIKCQRKTGKTAGKFDVYFINPEGKRLRSRRDISRYLKVNGVDLSLDLFCFKAGKNQKDFTNVMKRSDVKRGCKSLTHSLYFIDTETEDRSFSIGRYSSCVREKDHNMKEESTLNNQETAQQSVSDDHYILQRAEDCKVQTSPYFERNCLTPQKLNISACPEEMTSHQFTQEQTPNDFESVSPGLQKCLSLKPLRLNNFNGRNMFPKQSTTGIVRLPNQEEFSKETIPFQTAAGGVVATPEKIPDHYQRLPPGLQKFYSLKYTPPKSPFNLIQEELYTDPWKLLVATIFLNKTGGRNAIPVLWKFFEQFPDANATSRAQATQIEDIIQPLGLFRKRAQILIRFSQEYLEQMWHYPIELYGIGKYGNDSFRIFCLGEHQDVLPDDHKLNLYHCWLCEKDRERMTAST